MSLAGSQPIATLLGALAGLLVVGAIHDLLRAGPAVWGAIGRQIEPLLRAGREGYRPSRTELRRLALLGALLAVLTGATLFGLVLALPLAVVGAVLAQVAAGWRRKRYRVKLELALPEAAIAVADSVASGRSLRSALIELPAAVTGAAATEFSRLAADLDLGRPTGQALTGLAVRSGSPRVEAFCAALLAGRQSGGDLAALMRRFAGAAEAQDRARREARVATAQARLSGVLVVAMPGVAVLFAEFASPGFLLGLFSSPPALIMVTVALAMQALGFVLIRRLSQAPQ